jgi:phosphoribosylglycinamide formyltransferase-1
MNPTPNTYHIAIFASGSGSNAENIAHYFKKHPQIKVVAVFTNNINAGVIDRMRKFFIPVYVFNKNDFLHSNCVADELRKLQIDLIVLAGFLWLVPQKILDTQIPIVNIHPALLPKYGGKGMFGNNVHNAVISNNEIESGITIHKVSEEYDKGEIIFQDKVKVSPNETPESLAIKIHELEHKHFPSVIEKLLLV